MEPPVGSTLGKRFRLVEEVAAGSAGTLFRAEHVELGIDVAVKLVGRDHAAAARREAVLAARLRHPHIVHVLDAGDAPDGAWVAMEWVDGPTLATLLEDPRFDPGRRIAVLAQVASALAHAHANGITHADLSPRNVVVSTGRHGPIARLVDFGIAVDSSSDAAAGDVRGTPAYMAPEQARGQVPGPPADVYALGTILYEAVVGARPFAADGSLAVLARKLTEPPPAPNLHAMPPTSREPLGELLGECLALDASGRPSAADTRRRLLAIAEALPKRPATQDEQQHRRPVWPPLAAVAGVGALFITLTVAVIWEPSSSPDEGSVSGAAEGHPAPTASTVDPDASESEDSGRSTFAPVIPAAPSTPGTHPGSGDPARPEAAEARHRPSVMPGAVAQLTTSEESPRERAVGPRVEERSVTADTEPSRAPAATPREPSPDEAGSLLEQARSAQREGRRDDAIELYRRWLEVAPDGEERVRVERLLRRLGAEAD